MQVAVAGMEHVGDLEAVLRRRSATIWRQHLRQTAPSGMVPSMQ